VDLPPLRERPDLDELARSLTQAWTERAAQEIELTDDALEVLRSYAWPGNLRELESVLDASLAASSGPLLGSADLRMVPLTEFHITPPPALEQPQRGTPSPTVPEAEPRSAGSPLPDQDPQGSLELTEILGPLAQEVRQPLLALRTYASLLGQRPDDAGVRKELSTLVDEDLSQLDKLLARLESFTRFGPPKTESLDLPSLITSELEKRQVRSRARSLVLLRELDQGSPHALADDEQLRFALGALLDRALRMVPTGGDLYIGSHHHPAEAQLPARHRLLIRFHSPEEVLVAPDDTQGPKIPLDVLMARALILRMQGTFAIDSSGAQDNIIIIELPA
jgi:signal transduction histidine kinase